MTGVILVCVAAIAALSSCELTSGSVSPGTANPSSTTQPPRPVDPLTVSLVRADAGDLNVVVERPVPASENGAWMQHAIVLTNRGSQAIYLADTRQARVVGEASRPLLVGGDGCSFGVHSTTHKVMPFCNADLRAHVIDPGQSLKLTLSVWRDLPGSAPSRGEYEFRQPLAFTVDPALFRRYPTDPALTHGSITLRYQVNR